MFKRPVSPLIRHFAWRHLALPLAAALSLSGCAGYQIGARTLYPPDIRTVYVPMFESQSFRRNLGEWLTEAVVKEIDLRTPYKVVGTPNADSVLTGVIASDTRRVLVENPLDEPRLSELVLSVQVTWADRRGQVIREGAIALPPAMLDLTQSGKLVPEVGQSVATAQQKAIEDLARQIVALMETPAL